LFITPAVILTLGSYHGHFDHIIHDRIIYTAIGCLISIVATYIFPVWDSRQLANKLANAANDTVDFLFMALSLKQNSSETEKRMARKNANMSFAQLSEAIDSAKQEPMTKRLHFKSLYGMQITLYRINAIITSIFLSAQDKAQITADKQQIDEIIRDLSCDRVLQEELQRLSANQENHYLEQTDNLNHKIMHVGVLAHRYHQFYRDFQRL
jgi:uncharacterized membrane protein YccC